MANTNKIFKDEYEVPMVLVISFADDILAADRVSDEIGGEFDSENWAL